METYVDGNGRHETLAPKLQRAIEVLSEASDYARCTTSDRWEFAVEIQQLRSLGLDTHDLRYLVRKGMVDHAEETSIIGQNGRSFQPTGDLTFTESTCFVLTPPGILAAHRVGETGDRLSVQFAPRPTIAHAPIADILPGTPRWNADKRLLTLDQLVVKRFKWHAVNQEMVLAAFEEEGWPARIDDPLPPHSDQDAKRRLSDTIKCLNRKQTNRLVQFRGDGTGEGVVWEAVIGMR